MNQMLASLVFDHWFNRAPTPVEGDRKSHAGPGEGISAGPGEGISPDDSITRSVPPSGSRESTSLGLGGGVSSNMPIPEGKLPATPQDPSLELAPPKPEGADVPGYAMRSQGGKRFHDGAGLCSQGNRRPAFREVSHMALLGEKILQLTTEEDMRRDVYRLALGKCDSQPFSQEVLEKARNMWLEHLSELSGKEVNELAGVSEHQPFRLSAVHEHLKAIGDPDAEVFGDGPDTFQAGVPLGVEGMPRVPEVFEAKVKWRKYDPIPWPADKANYTSAVENATAVQRQFRKEQALGAMIEVEELDARREYGDRLRVAALAALEKSDHSFRVVHDATHGVGVNSKIKVEDQLRYPGPAEIKMALQSLIRFFPSNQGWLL